MEQSKTMAKHVKSKSKKEININPIVLDVFKVILIVTTIGAFMGWCTINWIDMDPKSLFNEWGINYWTGPKWYMDNIFIFMWIFKLASITYILFKNSKLSKEFFVALKDIGITIAFLLEYFVSLEIYKNYSFKLSGHALAISTATCIILIECERNASITNNHIFLSIAKFMLIFHSYILFWSSFAFHTFPEILSGLALGISTVLVFHLIIIKLIKDL